MRGAHRHLLTVPVTVLLFIAASAAWAQEAERANFVTITCENDVFFGRDSGYTNGIGFSWAHGPYDEFEGNIPRLFHFLTRRLYISTMQGKKRAVSSSFGQAMQTADDIEIEELVKEDAPYAGLLGWRGTLYAFDERVADRLSLELGIVGPASGAEQVQTFIHKVIGAEEPQGWDHQLSNEPVLRLEASRSWRYAARTWSSGVGMDLVGFVQGGAGNLISDAGAGMSLRFGHGLARTFPAATIYPARGVNPLAGMERPRWNAFVNVMGSYVFNDITINGNTFTESHSVELVHLQAVATAGIAFNLRNWAFTLSTARGTDRYETQSLPTRFGSLSVTCYF